MMLLTQFQPKIATTTLQEKVNFVLIDDSFSDLFTDVQIPNWKTFKFA